MQDAYTVTDHYPYSDPIGEINYMRNSVKVSIDAYDGSLAFYVWDESDPIVQTYRRIFPDLFRDGKTRCRRVCGATSAIRRTSSRSRRRSTPGTT